MQSGSAVGCDGSEEIWSLACHRLPAAGFLILRMSPNPHRPPVRIIAGDRARLFPAGSNRPGRLLIAFNLLGIMTIRDAAGRDHDICNGEGWVLRTNSEALTRVLHPGQGCSNLVIAIEAEAVTERLCRVIA